MATFNASGSLLPILLLAAALLLSAALTSEAQPSPPVLDFQGDEVRIGSLYRLGFGGIGIFPGGLTTLPTANETACAKPIGPGEETAPGLPVRIVPGNPWDKEGGVLRVGIRSTFTFEVCSHTRCKEPGEWTNATATSSDGEQVEVIIAGREPGRQRNRRWFEVRETSKKRVYTLSYCWCLPCRIRCPDIGAAQVDGNTVLSTAVVDDEEQFYPVQFFKYQPRPEAATKTATS